MKKLSYLPLITFVAFSLFACQANSISTSEQNYVASNVELNKETGTKTGKDFEVVKTVSNPKFWNKIELIKTTDSSVADEKMLARGRQRDADIVSCFGTDMPSSKLFCLHDMGEPNTLKYKTPILLVHGANTTATRSWVDPEGDGKKTGLGQYLKNQGFRVFAVTFANKHGDNFIWSSHIHRAISRIKEITNVDKVDTLGHSKGGFALRLYTSNINNGTFSYQDDVRKAIFVGTPHRGIDYSFRHSVGAWALYPENDNPVLYAPIVWTKILWEGTWRDSKENSFSGDYFPGQAQMVARWDKKYPIASVEPDWFTTYNGGQGTVSYSPGIDSVINKGGNLVQRVKNTPVVKSIKIAVLAGNKPNVPGILNELTGPSDGIAFVESAKYWTDINSSGAKLLDSQVMPLNHLDLVSSPTSMKWISEQLASEK